MDINTGESVLKTLTLSLVTASLLGACSTRSSAQLTPGLDAPVLAQAQEGQSLSGGDGQTSVAERWRREQLSIAQEADLVYKILAAEIAGRRGRVDIAASNYFDAATQTNDVRVVERAVKLALYSRDWDRADKAATMWVNLAPESVEAWQHRAQVSLQQKDVSTTSSALEKVINLSVRSPAEVLPGVVNSVLTQSDAVTGSKVLVELSERFPDNADTQYGIGRFAMSRGERETALKAFDRALNIDPDNIDAILSSARLNLEAGQGDDGLASLKAYLQKNPDNVPGQLGLSRLLVETGKYEEAADRFEVIASQFPEEPDALYSIGLLALEIKRVKQSEEYLLKVVELNKHEDSANYYLARISDSRRDYRQAIDRYQQVQDGDNFFDAQIRSAELYGLVGDVDSGRALLNKLKNYTEDRSIQIELINSESRLLNSSDMHHEALSVLSEGLMSYEDEPSLLYARALVAERLDQRDLFEEDLAKVIAAQPDNAYALNALGYFLVDRNERLDEAEDYLLKAYQLLPNDPAITDSVGWLYYRLGDYTKSIELLRQAHSLLPDSEIAAHLGEVLWVSGDQAEATKIWEEALRESPDDNLLNSVMKKYQP